MSTTVRERLAWLGHNMPPKWRLLFGTQALFLLFIIKYRERQLQLDADLRVRDMQERDQKLFRDGKSYKWHRCAFFSWDNLGHVTRERESKQHRTTLVFVCFYKTTIKHVPFLTAVFKVFLLFSSFVYSSPRPRSKWPSCHIFFKGRSRTATTVPCTTLQMDWCTVSMDWEASMMVQQLLLSIWSSVCKVANCVRTRFCMSRCSYRSPPYLDSS